MKRNLWVAGLLIAAATAPAFAEQDNANAAIGKVDTVLVRISKNFYIEKKLLRKTEGKELWVDVRFATSLPGGSAGELFQVSADLAIERGDLVMTRLGDPTPRELNLMPVVNRVTQLVAKHDTLMAMAFGLSNPKPAFGLVAEAQACMIQTPIRLAHAGTYIR